MSSVRTGTDLNTLHIQAARRSVFMLQYAFMLVHLCFLKEAVYLRHIHIEIQQVKTDDLFLSLFFFQFLCSQLNVFFFSYLGDGRFHLESIMIANPDIPAYR